MKIEVDEVKIAAHLVIQATALLAKAVGVDMDSVVVFDSKEEVIKILDQHTNQEQVRSNY